MTIDELSSTSNSEISVVRCKVFKDLWKKGFFVTAGTKFGADFLVYLGTSILNIVKIFVEYVFIFN